MNPFLLTLLKNGLPQLEAQFTPVVKDFIVREANSLLEGVLQPGVLRDALVAFVQANADAIVAEIFTLANQAVAHAA